MPFHLERMLGQALTVEDREVLPKNVTPWHYDLSFEVDLDNLKYEGSVSIDLKVEEDTDSIALNTSGLSIHSTEIITEEGENIASSDTFYDKSRQTLYMYLQRAAPRGSRLQIRQTFSRSLNKVSTGFFRSSPYQDDHGNIKYIASTQMEPTFARQAFPCFDEPALKATFTITLIAENHLTCLSNMDISSEEEVLSVVDGKPKKSITFNTTPPMSTYIVAFVVGDLRVIETTEFRIPIRVYAVPSRDIEHGSFALELAIKSLAFYEKAFGIDFPLPKLDMIAVPGNQGAMENWGLITYAETVLLCDKMTTSAGAQETLTEVVAHEIGHQWFGNLVTMDFWDGLWLNESFASWASALARNSISPERRAWQEIMTGDMQKGLALDSLRHSHAIEARVGKPDEINQIFDAISYSKGCSIIQMLSTYLGEETFLKGVSKYLNEFAYGNSVTDDLWTALSYTSGQDIRSMLQIWIKQVGYPVVMVSENDAKGTIQLEQHRFLQTADATEEEDMVIFPIWLNIRSKHGVDRKTRLFERQTEIPVLPDFYKLNGENTGFYRVCYPPRRLKMLYRSICDGLLTTQDRIGLVSDTAALAAAGYYRTSLMLSLFEGLDSEEEYFVWVQILSDIKTLRIAWEFEDEMVKESLNNYTRKLVHYRIRKLGWDIKPDDDHKSQEFKALLFDAAGKAGDAEITNAAFTIFEDFVSGKTSISPTIRDIAFAIVSQRGDVKQVSIHFISIYI
jgi:aminopeptidase 2